jgi:hypothetical protein
VICLIHLIETLAIALFHSDQDLDHLWNQVLIHQLEHRFSNRGAKEKSVQREVKSAEESSENGCQAMLIAINKV